MESDENKLPSFQDDEAKKRNSTANPLTSITNLITLNPDKKNENINHFISFIPNSPSSDEIVAFKKEILKYEKQCKRQTGKHFEDFVMRLGVGKFVDMPINDKEWTILHYAAKFAALEFCYYLINTLKADFTLKDIEGKVPWQIADQFHNSRTARILKKRTKDFLDEHQSIKSKRQKKKK